MKTINLISSNRLLYTLLAIPRGIARVTYGILLERFLCPAIFQPFFKVGNSCVGRVIFKRIKYLKRYYLVDFSKRHISYHNLKQEKSCVVNPELLGDIS